MRTSAIVVVNEDLAMIEGAQHARTGLLPAGDRLAVMPLSPPEADEITRAALPRLSTASSSPAASP